MMTLKTVLMHCKVEVHGFFAFSGLESYAVGDIPAILATDSPSMLYSKGIREYLAPDIPRGVIYAHTSLIPDSLPVYRYSISEIRKDEIEPQNMDTIIVSGHAATCDILKLKYPHAVAIMGSVTPDDIKDKHVVGTLPSTLVQHAGAYTSAVVINFDRVVDHDLEGPELYRRLRVSDVTIRVTQLPDLEFDKN